MKQVTLELPDSDYDELEAMARRNGVAPREQAEKIVLRDLKIARANVARHGPSVSPRDGD